MEHSHFAGHRSASCEPKTSKSVMDAPEKTVFCVTRWAYSASVARLSSPGGRADFLLDILGVVWG